MDTERNIGRGAFQATDDNKGLSGSRVPQADPADESPSSVSTVGCSVHPGCSHMMDGLSSSCFL